MGRLMDALRRTRIVDQPTQAQPMKGLVPKVWYKPSFIAHQPGWQEGYSVHATRDILTGPVWGATNPTAFISIHGVPPTTPIVAQVASVAGSNAPTGGNC